MTEIVNAAVTHKNFGEGKITDLTNGYITVSFDTFEKKFVYPDVFKNFLNLHDSLIAEKVNEAIKIKENEEREIKKRHEELKKIQELYKFNKKNSEIKIKKKPDTRRNIVFKCNYNDDEDQTCFDGQMMLGDWKTFAGRVKSGENKDKPKKFKNIRHNSLALLTTRLPSTKEAERIVFGAFLVDDIFEGNDSDEAYVAAKSKYKIKLTVEEAQKMKFWNYYSNPNKVDVIQWGSGLFHYLNDDQAIQILQELVKLKEKTPEAQLSKDFLSYFCQINHIDTSIIGQKLNGSLMQ